MQFAPLIKWIQNINNNPIANVLRRICNPLYDRQSSVFLSPAGGAGLVIFGASSPIVKTGGSICLGIANGVFWTIPASTSMPALVGTVPQNTFGGWAFFVDQGGNLSSLFMNSSVANSIVGMTFAQFPVGKAFIGFVYVNPTTAPFVGGTTNLDAANTNAVFVSPTEAFDPYCTIGGQLTNS